MTNGQRPFVAADERRANFRFGFRLQPTGCHQANGWNRRTAAARHQAETLLERPVFRIERSLSNAWGIRGSCGRDVAIERRRGHAEAVRDLCHADVGIGQQRLGGLDVVVGEFRRASSESVREHC